MFSAVVFAIEQQVHLLGCFQMLYLPIKNKFTF